MCMGEVGVYTFSSEDLQERELVLKTKAKKMCVRWEELDKWSRGRMIERNAELKGGVKGPLGRGVRCPG
jgi:hypothetical protein